MKLEQAARQALEALIEANVVSERYQNAEKREQAITALQEALAEQAEQEPVGYFAYDEEHDIWEELTGPNAPGATPLYAAPVRTKDLTDDELREIHHLDQFGLFCDYDEFEQIARAVIAKDREKNK